jgi:hypothetical protein
LRCGSSSRKPALLRTNEALSSNPDPLKKKKKKKKKKEKEKYSCFVFPARF